MQERKAMVTLRFRYQNGALIPPIPCPVGRREKRFT
jgi:hypothetical protein